MTGMTFLSVRRFSVCNRADCGARFIPKADEGTTPHQEVSCPRLPRNGGH